MDGLLQIKDLQEYNIKQNDKRNIRNIESR